MRGYKVTITDTAAVLIAADDKNREGLIKLVTNESIALGNASVTFAEGYLVAKGSEPCRVAVPLKETVWAIADSGKSVDVRVLLPDAD
jgi:hypothetical protein